MKVDDEGAALLVVWVEAALPELVLDGSPSAETAPVILCWPGCGFCCNTHFSQSCFKRRQDLIHPMSNDSTAATHASERVALEQKGFPSPRRFSGWPEAF